MKRMIPTLIAASVALSTAGCTKELLNQATALLQQAGIQLTTTDESGQEAAIDQDDVSSVELDGTQIPAQFDANGELILPEGDYASERQLKVRMRSGEIVLMPLKPNMGKRDGKKMRFAGELHRAGGKVIAGDVLPGGGLTAEARMQHLQRRYVVVDLNKPGLHGKLRQRGIGKHRLPHDAFVVSPEGDLLIQPGVLHRYANHPGIKLWAVAEVKPGVFRLLVIRLDKPPVPPAPPASAPGTAPTAEQGTVVAESSDAATTEELDVGEEVTVETSEATGDVVDPATFDPATEEDLVEGTAATTETSTDTSSSSTEESTASQAG